MPEGIEAHAHSKLPQAALLELSQSDIRLLLDPASERPAVFLKPRLAVASDLFWLHMPPFAVLIPDTFHRAPAHRKALPHLAGPNAGFEAPPRSGRADPD